MTVPGVPHDAAPDTVVVRYWAAARAAAGIPEERLEAAGWSVADLVARLGAQRPALARVLAHCSVLIGDEPLGGRSAADVEVPAGATVEFLPPFAGG